MATAKQSPAAKENIKKAQAKWKAMSKRQHSLAQPEGRKRKKPGTGGKGNFYHIMVRPKTEFKTFRTQDVGESGHLERIAGKRSSGSWDTASWLVNKEDAHMDSKDRLIIDNPKVRTLLKQIRGDIKLVNGDVFESKPRRNIPEKNKPTPRQRRAQSMNIKKAQAARRKKTKSSSVRKTA
jgi:hypothetical protein